MVPRETPLYRLTYHAVRFLLRLFFNFRIEGLAHVPPGAALVVANHPSALDPVVLAAALPRRALFVGAAEFFTMPFVGWAMRAHGTIPVHRGQVDLTVVRATVRALEAGALLGIFPEGRISPENGPLKPGAGILAARARVPTLPAAIFGTGRALPLGHYIPRPTPLRVVFGPALPPPPPGDRAAADHMVEQAMSWVREILRDNSP